MTTRRKKKNGSFSKSCKATLNYPQIAPIAMAEEIDNVIVNEPQVVQDTNTIVEDSDFEHVAKSTSAQFKEEDVHLSQCSQSTLFS